MNTNTKMEYETPQIELINARVEKGFQGSNNLSSTRLVGDQMGETEPINGDLAFS